MSQSPIELKGSSFTLSVVHLHNSQPEVIRQALQEKVEQAPAFLKNAPVVINVATLDGDANWKELQQAVAAAGLRVVGISGCRDERQKRAIARAGLPLLSEGKGQRWRRRSLRLRPWWRITPRQNAYHQHACPFRPTDLRPQLRSYRDQQRQRRRRIDCRRQHSCLRHDARSRTGRRVRRHAMSDFLHPPGG